MLRSRLGRPHLLTPLTRSLRAASGAAGTSAAAKRRQPPARQTRPGGRPRAAPVTAAVLVTEKGREANILRDALPEAPTAPALRRTMQPKLLPVRLAGGGLAADGGYAILDGVGAAFSARPAPGMDGALVLGAAASGNASAGLDAVLGSLRCKRFLACARIKLWWMTPEWGSRAGELPPETQFLLLQLAHDGPYAVLLPLIDSGRFRATLRPPRKGQDGEDSLRLRIESGDASVTASSWDSAVLVAAGYDPYHLVDLAVAQGAQLSGGAKARCDKVVPDFVDRFGWCTWDAFYSTVSAEGLQQGLRSLQEGGVPPGFLIIDDGWQQTAADKAEGGQADLTRLEAKKQMLKRVGAGGHYPTDTLASSADAAKQPQRSWLAEVTEVSIGRLQALAETALFAVYKGFVESAPEGSWRIAAFSALTQGVLKAPLLAYYALTTDHTRRLQGVAANGKFSSTRATPDTPIGTKADLAAIVADAKERFGVKYVYAWHSLHGYWAGIATGSGNPAMPYNAQLVMPQPTPGVLEVDPCFAWAQQCLSGVGVAEDVTRLYQDMHSYLAGAGIDGVKVDCQAILGMVGGGSPGLGGGPALSAQYHAALEASVARHFPGNNCINCMCHSTEDIYRMESTTVARSSDDFWPRDPASHTTHVAVNAFNSLFMGALLVPDWDMFHSRHPAALLHATARVVSGGPVYVSDKPGQHDIALLRRIVLADGTLLRCRQPGRPTLDCLFADVLRNRDTVLKVWNVNACTGVLAAFNLQGASWDRRLRRYAVHDGAPAALTATICPGDVPVFKDKRRGTRYAVYSDAQRRLWQSASWEGTRVTLRAGESDIFAISPLSDDGTFAPLGLTNMLNCGGAVSGWDPHAQRAAGDAFAFSVRGSGQLLAFCSAAPTGVTANGQPVPFEHSPADCSLTVQLSAERSEIVVSI